MIVKEKETRAVSRRVSFFFSRISLEKVIKVYIFQFRLGVQ